ncbi:MAG: FCD domain-containing protein [Alphaproteobacteria bacterium]
MDRFGHTVDVIRGMVTDESIVKDGRLPTERELCSMIGVGRRLLRRALDTLEVEGVLVRQQGRGTFVRQQDPANDTLPDVLPEMLSSTINCLAQDAGPIEQIELKFVLEPTMARLAATRASLMDIERLRKAAEKTSAAATAEAYQEADQQFHAIIAECSRNTLFQSLYTVVENALRDAAMERFRENGRCFKRQSVHAGFHKRVATAIAKRDGDTAAREMYEHLRDVHSSLFVENLPVSLGRDGKKTATA